MKARDWLPQVILDLNAEYKKAIKKAKIEDRTMVTLIYEERRKELYRSLLGDMSREYPECNEVRVRRIRK